MARIIDSQESKTFLSRESRGRIVLAGGCFDILHIGHVRFLSEARKLGDYLVLLLESDEKVRKLKGENRPIFIQKERAEMLAALRSVDLVILLPTTDRDADYVDLVMEIRPRVIAVTEKDPQIEKKKEQARKIGAELKVVSLVKTVSTSILVQMLGID